MPTKRTTVLDGLALQVATRVHAPAYRAPQPPFDSPEVYSELGLHLEVVPDLTLDDPSHGGRPRHEAVRLTFPSRVQTEWPECNVATGELYLLTGRPRAPIVVLVHGNGSRSPAYEHHRARQLLAAGCHAARLSYAHHHDRIPTGERSAGHTLSPDLHGCVQTWVQAAGDSADLVRWLRQQPYVDGVGMAGWSGGGLTTMLAMTLVDLDFALPVVPATDMSVALWVGPGHERIREHVGSVERLAWMVRAIAPALRTPTIPERFLMLAGRRDHISGVEATVSTWRAWGEPPMEWLPTGHMGGIIHPRVRRRLLAVATGFPTRPTRLPRL